MDILALRVYNAMNSLGLTEDQLVSIGNEAVSDNTGVANMAYVKKGEFLIYIDHDNKNTINISKIEKGKEKVPIPSRILTRCLVPFAVPKDAFKIHELARYRVKDWEYDCKPRNVKELKKRFIERLNGKTVWPMGDMGAVFWLFDAKYEFRDIQAYQPRENFSEIVKVFELGDQRLAVFKRTEAQYDRYPSGISYRNDESTKRLVNSYYVRSFSPKDKEYNYVDKGRELWHDIWICDELKGKISNSECVALSEVAGIAYNVFFLLDERLYGELQNKARLRLMTARRDEMMQKAEGSLRSQLEKDFNAGKEVQRNGVFYSKNKIRFADGFEITGPDITTFITKQRYLYQDSIGFRTIYDGYVDFLLGARSVRNYISDRETIEIEFEGSKTVKFGNIKSVISREREVYRINGKRIRKDEMANVLRNAITFSSQEKYDEFIASVNKVPLEVQDLIRKGVNITLKLNMGYDNTSDNDLLKTETNYLMNFKIASEKNGLVLVSADKRYKIKDMPLFIQMKDQPNNSSIYNRYGNQVNRFCSMLSRAVDIPPEDVGKLIKNGQENYKITTAREQKELADKITRSKAFIANAVRIAKAQMKKVENDKFKAIGWEIKSITGRRYFVTDAGGTYAFTSEKDMKYLCIIDTNQARTEYEKNDSVAKRILALYHDKQTASEIFTLKDEMKRTEEML